MKNHNKLVQIIEIYMQNVPLRGIIFRTKQDNESPEQTLKRFLSSYGEKVLEHVMKKSFVETTAKKFSSPYGEKVLELGPITDTWDPGIQFSSPYGEKVLEHNS